MSKPLDDRAQDHWEAVCAMTRLNGRTGPSVSRRLVRRIRQRIGTFLVGTAVRLAGRSAVDTLLALERAELPS